MIQRRVSWSRGLILGAVLVGCGGATDEPGAAVPVTAGRVLARATVPRTSAPGEVVPLAEITLRFGVSGRLAMVRAEGHDARGAVRDGEGARVREGDVLAALEPGSFERVVAACQAELAATRARLASQQVDLDLVGTAELASREAQRQALDQAVLAAQGEVNALTSSRRIARLALERERDLSASGASTESNLDRARADFEAAEARLARAQSLLEEQQRQQAAAQAAVSRAEAQLHLKQAAIEATRAEALAAERRLLNAEHDLEHLQLRAPFAGQVTRVLLPEGAHVDAETPVLTLTRIDPVRVAATVPGALLGPAGAGLRPGARVTVRHGSEGQSLPGVITRVERLPETAHARVEVLVRNRRLEERPRPQPALLPVVRPDANARYVPAAAIWDQAGSRSVLKWPDAPGDPPVVPQRVEVTLAEGFAEWNGQVYRALDAGDLEEGDLLVLDPRPSDVQTGVRLHPRAWALAPGDEVEVELPDLVIERALWVPSAAIERAGERLRVFAIRDGVAHAVAVEVVDGRGDWSRVVGEGLSEGDALVLTGVGFVSDGDDVRVLRDTTPAAPSEAP